MSKKQLRPIRRLPSGFGSIRFMGKGRTRPYAVHPPAVKVKSAQQAATKAAVYTRPAPIAYVSSWHIGFAVLVSYHAGTYTPGMEDDLEETLREPCEINAVETVAGRICEDYQRMRRNRSRRRTGCTVAEVFDAFMEYKFEKNVSRALSNSRRNQMNAAYQAIRAVEDRRLDDLGINEWQDLVNALAAPGQGSCVRDGKSCSSISNVVFLIKNLYKFALPRELCTKNYGLYVSMPETREVEHYPAFDDGQIRILWEHSDDETVKNILILIYSGFRVSALKSDTFIVDMKNHFFRGGIKTVSGKDRIVPMHSAIIPLVDSLLWRERDQGSIIHPIRFYSGKSVSQFRRDVKAKLKTLGLPALTPHSCRHTFHRLLELAGVSEADRKRLMGHSLKKDVLNGTYGHRGLEELRAEIEKVKVPCLR